MKEDPNSVANGRLQCLVALERFQCLMANRRLQCLMANGRRRKNTFSPLPTFPDALLGPGVNPLEGSPNVKLRKLGPKGTLPTSNSRKG